MNGKGDKLRKGANLELFRNNYDNISFKETKDKINHTRKNITTSELSDDGTAELGDVLPGADTV